jgi:hypothetical protein
MIQPENRMVIAYHQEMIDSHSIASTGFKNSKEPRQDRFTEFELLPWKLKLEWYN